MSCPDRELVLCAQSPESFQVELTWNESTQRWEGDGYFIKLHASQTKFQIFYDNDTPATDDDELQGECSDGVPCDPTGYYTGGPDGTWLVNAGACVDPSPCQPVYEVSVSGATGDANRANGVLVYQTADPEVWESAELGVDGATVRVYRQTSAPNGWNMILEDGVGTELGFWQRNYYALCPPGIYTNKPGEPTYGTALLSIP